MVKGFEKAVKEPVKGKGTGNINPTVMGNEKVVVEIIDKVKNHGKAFTFHDDR